MSAERSSSSTVREKEGRNSILQSKGNRRSDSIAFFQTLFSSCCGLHTHTHTHLAYWLTKGLQNCELSVCLSLNRIIQYAVAFFIVSVSDRVVVSAICAKVFLLTFKKGKEIN